MLKSGVSENFSKRPQVARFREQTTGWQLAPPRGHLRLSSRLCEVHRDRQTWNVLVIQLPQQLTASRHQDSPCTPQLTA